MASGWLDDWLVTLYITVMNLMFSFESCKMVSSHVPLTMYMVATQDDHTGLKPFMSGKF